MHCGTSSDNFTVHFYVKRKTIDSRSLPGRMIDARFHRRHSDKKGQNLQFYSRASRTIDFAGSIMLSFISAPSSAQRFPSQSSFQFPSGSFCKASFSHGL